MNLSGVSAAAPAPSGITTTASPKLEHAAHQFEASMLTEPLIAACPPQLRAPLARYLADGISGEITLMHFALYFGGTRALAETLESLAAAAYRELLLIGDFAK